jgi:hypothetical protein
MMFVPGKKIITAVLTFCWTAAMLAAQDAGGDSGSPPPPYHEEPPRGHPAAQQHHPNRVPPGFMHRALSFNIVARIFEKADGEDWVEVWQADIDKNTISGQPVAVKLAGTNVIVLAQFTPYLRKGKPMMLVAQGQIWVEDENHGVHYQTTLRTIAIEFGEEIFYFPLGERSENSTNFIEICIVINPYTEEQ